MEKYSVLMSVYHKEKAEFFKLAINSMLSQTVPPDEFVLICDGPLTEQLDAVIEAFCGQYPSLFKVIRLEKNMGLGIALGIGLQECSNELVARMDTDDIAVPQRLEIQLAALRKNPNISAMGGQIAEFCDDPDVITDYRRVPCEPDEIRGFIKKRNPMNHMTVVLRKSHVLKVGNYQDIKGFEDYFLWARLTAAGCDLGNVDAVCCRVRADDNLYSRRGGFRYFKTTMRVERFLLEKKIITRWQYNRNLLVRFTGTVLIPPKFRKTMFMRFLRQRKLETKCPEKENV